MKNIIKIKCPAKINLTLEVVNKREDGFHNIKSIMQMLNLYDYLTISINESEENEIILLNKEFGICTAGLSVRNISVQVVRFPYGYRYIHGNQRRMPPVPEDSRFLLRVQKSL